MTSYTTLEPEENGTAVQGINLIALEGPDQNHNQSQMEMSEI